MKHLSLMVVGAAIVSAALSFAAMPAFALGGCGANFHRDAHGDCVAGGQNEDYCMRTKGHPAERMPNGTMVCR